MNFKNRLLTVIIASALLTGVLVGALLLTGNSVAASAAQDSINVNEDEREGSDVPITGDALDKASAAALEFTGGSRVTETEVGDEEGFYEVEVTLDGGRQVDVHLDENFNFLSQEADGAGSDD